MVTHADIVRRALGGQGGQFWAHPQAEYLAGGRGEPGRGEGHGQGLVRPYRKGWCRGRDGIVRQLAGTACQGRC